MHNEPKFCDKCEGRYRQTVESGLHLSKKATQFSSILIVLKKKYMKIRVCVDYEKLNVGTIVNPFPLPFMESLFDDIER